MKTMENFHLLPNSGICMPMPYDLVGIFYLFLLDSVKWNLINDILANEYLMRIYAHIFAGNAQNRLRTVIFSVFAKKIFCKHWLKQKKTGRKDETA
jgi:hypothetical protein